MSEYWVILETDGKSWSAYAPDLLGCVASAPTQEATLELMREAIEFHIEGLRIEGLPVPPPTTYAAPLRITA